MLLTTALRARTVFPYEAQRDQDLSFIENVVIEAHPAKDPMGAWWYGTLVKEGKKGWFPSAYIEEMSRKSNECAPQECTNLFITSPHSVSGMVEGIYLDLG